MSSTSRASLDPDWELATSKSSPTQVLSDDDLDSLGLSAPPSELGDEPWDGFDDDNESPFLDPITEDEDDHQATLVHEHDDAIVYGTPLQASLELNTGIIDDDDLTVSGIQGSEDSSTNSTFSFHFPDPLVKSGEDETFAKLCEPQHESDSEAETESVAGTDAVEDEETKEREATLIPRNPSFATSSRSRSFFATGIAIFAIFVACLIWNPLHIGQPVLPTPNEKMMELLSTQSVQRMPECPTVLSTAVRPDLTIPPLINDKPERPRLLLEAPPSSGFFIGSFDYPNPVQKSRPNSLSLNPILQISSSLSETYSTFSKIIFQDLRDVLDLIDELLLFMRSHVPVEQVQQHSRTLLDYLAEKVADRHERAKHNARILREKTLQFAKVASVELALRQETAVENAKNVWNEVKKWTR